MFYGEGGMCSIIWWWECNSYIINLSRLITTYRQHFQHQRLNIWVYYLCWYNPPWTLQGHLAGTFRDLKGRAALKVVGWEQSWAGWCPDVSEVFSDSLSHCAPRTATADPGTEQSRVQLPQSSVELQSHSLVPLAWIAQVCYVLGLLDMVCYPSALVGIAAYPCDSPCVRTRIKMK